MITDNDHFNDNDNGNNNVDDQENKMGLHLGLAGVDFGCVIVKCLGLRWERDR